MFQVDFQKPMSIYFVGIGGISMSALAEILHSAGFQVSGSDWKESPITQGLAAKGITVKYGESADHITRDIDCAVLTSAVKDTNREFLAIKELGIPYLTRAQLLGQIMQNYHCSVAVSGTHGKTTVSSMISEILLEADTDPTLLIGGIYKPIAGNARVGGKNYFLTEACEYTNSFLSFHPTIGVILNIEEDHLDFFKDLADIRNSFREFARLLPANGYLIMNKDIENYLEIAGDLPCKVITYSLSDQTANYYPENISSDALGHPSFTAHCQGTSDVELTLSVAGMHNIGNALASLAVADCLSVSRSLSRQALKKFHGTDRRFEYKGTIAGITVVDDYAHHPTEITATLTAAKGLPHQTLWCVFQPHTYSRTKAFLDDFAKALSLADKIVLAPIYPARETDTLGMSSSLLAEKINLLGGDCKYFESFDEIENYLLENCIKGDMLITMGAGDVHKIGENLLGL